MSDTEDGLHIARELFPFMDRLAPGVLGYTIDQDDGELWIPLIHAEIRGNGDVGRYLDSLPTDRTVVVPNVVSPRLVDMLERRGFVAELVRVEGEDEDEKTWAWKRPAE